MNGERIPIWVADYVLMEYGTGAIMAVPAHDERDYAFAERYGIEIRQVVAPADGSAVEGAFVAHTENEVLVNSGEFSGMLRPKASERSSSRSPKRARAAIRYRLRDWLLSRQRYCRSSRVVHCDGCGIVPVPDDELPYCCRRSTSTCRRRSPLAAAEDWVATTCPRCAAPRDARRTRWTRSSTRPGTSCATPTRRTTASRSRAVADYWLPVNQYIGGIEHAILHLLYARFFVKVMNDSAWSGSASRSRASSRRECSTGTARRCPSPRGTRDLPDEYVERYGADAARMYLLFIGPVDQDAEWHLGLEGIGGSCTGSGAS